MHSARLERILITNDDGIDAPGLEALEAVAHELADEVWVVAPDHDQSGISTAISIHHPLRVTQRGEHGAGDDDEAGIGEPGEVAKRCDEQDRDVSRMAGLCHPNAFPTRGVGNTVR